MAQAKGFTTLSLPNELVNKIDEFVKTNSMGFRSRPEVAKAALREFFERRKANE